MPLPPQIVTDSMAMYIIVAILFFTLTAFIGKAVWDWLKGGHVGLTMQGIPVSPDTNGVHLSKTMLQFCSKQREDCDRLFVSRLQTIAVTVDGCKNELQGIREDNVEFREWLKETTAKVDNLSVLLASIHNMPSSPIVGIRQKKGG